MTPQAIENAIRSRLNTRRSRVQDVADDPTFYDAKADLRTVFADATIEILPRGIRVWYGGAMGVVPAE